MYWLISRNSNKLSLNKNLLLYKAILKPIWTYGIQLWGKAANFLANDLISNEGHRRLKRVDTLDLLHRFKTCVK